MKTQQAGQENTLLEVNVIPEEMDFLPRSTASPELPKHCKTLASLVRMMGLVILGLVVGFILTMVIYKPAGKQLNRLNSTCMKCNDPGPLNHADKVYVNGSLKESGEPGRYDIFTASKNAHYFIYVQVRHRDKSSKGLVYQLVHRWKSQKPVKIIDFEDSHFGTELELFKESSVYLLFKEKNDKPDEENSFFRIFEIRQRGNGHS